MVLVNHHSEVLLRKKAAAMLAAGFDVTVVDNSDSYAGPGRVLRPGRNVGFGMACNLAVTSAPTAIERICLHNPDVSASPLMIDRLCDALNDQKRPGVVAPAVRIAGTLRDRGYRYPALSREVAIALLANGTRSEGNARRIWKSGLPSGGRRFATGALLVVDRTAWDMVGGYDERYFLYVEDLDLWERLSKAGYDVRFKSGVVVLHEGGKGSPLGRAPREILRRLGVEYFAESHQIGWRAYRLVHRSLFTSLSSGAPVLAEAVLHAWKRHYRPAQVLEKLRPGLESGDLFRSRP